MPRQQLHKHPFVLPTSPKVIKKRSCSTQLSLKFMMLTNVKLPTIVTIVGTLTFSDEQNM